jgi:hypothetical protein
VTNVRGYQLEQLDEGKFDDLRGLMYSCGSGRSVYWYPEGGDSLTADVYNVAILDHDRFKFGTLFSGGLDANRRNYGASNISASVDLEFIESVTGAS